MERPADQPPWTRQELLAARERPPEERTALPTVGERVLFRHEDWGPEVPAVITSVQPLDQVTDTNGVPGDEHDPHVWQRIPGGHVLRPDPWPRVRLDLASGHTAVSRESRVRGAAGWLRPADDHWMHEGTAG